MNEPEKAELRPCPFCGSTDLAAYRAVRCNNCKIETPKCDSWQETLDYWNRRPTAPAVKLLLDGNGLRKELKTLWNKFYNETHLANSLNEKTALAYTAKGIDAAIHAIDSGRFTVVPQEAERDMTAQEAIAELVKRNMEFPFIGVETYGYDGKILRFKVGSALGKPMWEGPSFRSAFAQADAQADKPKEGSK